MAVFRVERNKELILKAKGTIGPNAVTSQRLGLHPCKTITEQLGKY